MPATLSPAGCFLSSRVRNRDSAVEQHGNSGATLPGVSHAARRKRWRQGMARHGARLPGKPVRQPGSCASAASGEARLLHRTEHTFRADRRTAITNGYIFTNGSVAGSGYWPCPFGCYGVITCQHHSPASVATRCERFTFRCDTAGAWMRPATPGPTIDSREPGVSMASAG